MRRADRSLAAFAPPLVVLVGAFALLQLITVTGWVPAFLVPKPTAAVRSLITNGPEIAGCLRDTALAAVAGVMLSTTIGVSVAIALSSGVWVRRAFYPYAVFFQTVPIVAIAPLLAVWFGLTMNAVIASAFLASVFPVIANTLAGLLSVDAALLDLFQLYRAGRLATLLKLRLPYALPQILTGLRVASGLAVIGAIVGEFITGGGLGGLILIARQQRDIAKVFAVLFVSALLGVAMFAIINAVAAVALRHWHASERGKGA